MASKGSPGSGMASVYLSTSQAGPSPYVPGISSRCHRGRVGLRLVPRLGRVGLLHGPLRQVVGRRRLLHLHGQVHLHGKGGVRVPPLVLLRSRPMRQLQLDMMSHRKMATFLVVVAAVASAQLGLG
jgi:hypothetical protein